MITPLVDFDYVIYSMCLTWLIYLTLYVQECTYIHLLYVQIAWLWICVCTCYWLLFVCYAIGWAYFTKDMQLCGCYVITDLFMSLFMSHIITTFSFL